MIRLDNRTTPSERVLRACALFGLRCGDRSLSLTAPVGPAGCARASDDRSRPPSDFAHAWRLRAVAEIDAALPPGACALIVGPSGAGKSLLLRALQQRLRANALAAKMSWLEKRLHVPLADLAGESLDEWLRALARAGLAEARLLPQPVRTLSQGQRWRALLARTLLHAEHQFGSAAPAPPPGATPRYRKIVLIDEFTSVLDRQTAAGVALCVGRWVGSQSAFRLVAAASQDDILESLRPRMIVHIPLDAPPEVLMA